MLLNTPSPPFVVLGEGHVCARWLLRFALTHPRIWRGERLLRRWSFSFCPVRLPADADYTYSPCGVSTALVGWTGERRICGSDSFRPVNVLLHNGMVEPSKQRDHDLPIHTPASVLVR